MKYRTVIALVCILALTSLAFAQPERPPGPPPGGPGMRPPRDGGPGGSRGFGAPDKWDEEEVREMIETMRMTRIARRLELDKEQTVLLLRRTDEIRTRGIELAQHRQEAMQTLRTALEEKASPEKLDELLQAVWELDNAIHEHRMESGKKISEGLTAEQQARLYLLVHDFERDMRHLINRAREHIRRTPRSRGDDESDEQSDQEAQEE